MVSVSDDAYGFLIRNLTENGDLYFSTHAYPTERAADEISSFNSSINTKLFNLDSNSTLMRKADGDMRYDVEAFR